jgi:hypothetical protein
MRHRLLSVASNAGAMLVEAHDVDHLHGSVISGSKDIHNPVPDASPAPAHKTIIASRVWAKLPGRLRLQDPSCYDHSLRLIARFIY